MATTSISISRLDEKAALQAVLQSDLFRKSASQSQFLSYICKKYFAGEASQIKEYHVAVEALGRSADFNPKQDPIVRVEGCRLRKRLKKTQMHKAECGLGIVFSGGGKAVEISLASVRSGGTEEFYRMAREGGFSYEIPLKPGTYELHLFFSRDLGRSSPDAGRLQEERIFCVYANGVHILKYFDLNTEVAVPGNITMKSFKYIRPVAGKRRLDFVPLKAFAHVAAIEVIPLVDPKSLARETAS